MKAMKVIYNLKHTQGVANTIASFTDKRKAEQAFEIFSDYIKDNCNTDVEWECPYYRHFKNDEILEIETSELITDLNVFKKMF